MTRAAQRLMLFLIGAALAGCTTATNDPAFALDHATAATATPTLVILPPSFGTSIGTDVVPATQTPIASAPVATAGLADHLWSIRELLTLVPIPTNSI